MNAHTSSTIMITALLLSVLSIAAMIFVAMERSDIRAAEREKRLEATVGPCQESFHNKDDSILCHPLADLRNDGFSIRCVCP